MGIPGLFGLLLMPVMVLGSPVLLIIAMAAAGRSLLRGRRRRALSILLAVALPIVLWWPTLWLATLTHLVLTAGFGIGQIGDPFVSEDGQFRAYDWSVGLVTNPSTFLIHDTTDRIAQGGVERHGFRCATPPRRLAGHYYLCSL